MTELIGVMYSTIDRGEFTNRLITDLEAELPNGHQLLLRINEEDFHLEALKQVKALLIVVSHEFAINERLLRMYNLAIDEYVKNGIKIIPIVLNKEDPISKLPFASGMGGIEFYNFSYRVAMGRVIWGITGKRPDYTW